MGNTPDGRAAPELPGVVLAGAALLLFVASAAASTVDALKTRGPGSGRFLVASSGYGLAPATAVLAAGLLLFAHSSLGRSHLPGPRSASFWRSAALGSWLARAVVVCAVVAVAVDGAAAAVQIDVFVGAVPTRVGIALTTFLAAALVSLVGAAAAIVGGRGTEGRPASGPAPGGGG